VGAGDVSEEPDSPCVTAARPKLVVLGYRETESRRENFESKKLAMQTKRGIVGRLMFAIKRFSS
jgi:hypothetical protein